MSWPGAPARGASLPPPGQAAEEGAGVARLYDIGAEPEPLHHTRAKALDQRIGMGQEIEHLGDRVLVLQVEFDNLAPASGRRFEILLRADAIERHYFRAHIRQHHAGKRSRSDAGKFYNTETRK